MRHPVDSGVHRRVAEAPISPDKNRLLWNGFRHRGKDRRQIEVCTGVFQLISFVQRAGFAPRALITALSTSDLLSGTVCPVNSVDSCLSTLLISTVNCRSQQGPIFWSGS